MYFYDEEDTESLSHHGIKGQKWGVRRYQYRDGTLTPRGKAKSKEKGELSLTPHGNLLKNKSTKGTSLTGSKNNSSDDQNGDNKKQIDAKKIAKGVAIAGAVAGATALAINPTTRNALAKYGKTTLSSLKNTLTSDSTKNKVKEIGTKAGKKLSQRATKVGDAMVDAALLSVGGIAISKVNQKYADDENASEAERNKNQILRDTITGGIKAATGSNNSNNSSNKNKGGSVGKEVTDKIGAPSNKGVDKQSSEWQDLFKGRDSDTRATIKSLAAAGYDIEQIDKYLNHSEIDLTPYMSYLIGV